MKEGPRSLNSITALISGQLGAALLGGIGTIIQNRFIGPNVLGEYSGYGVLGGYLTFLQLGSIAALRRDFPFLLGSGKKDESNSAASTVLGWICLISALSALIYLDLATSSLFRENYQGAAAWASQLVYVAVQFYSLYLGCTYRSTSEFAKWSLYTFLGSVVSLIVLPLVVYFGFWGICIRTAIPAATTMIMLHARRPVRVKPRLEFRRLLVMLKFGLPVDLAGNLATAGVVSTMSWIVLKAYGVTALGLLATAKLIEGVITQMSQAVLQVYSPKIAFLFGKTSSKIDCARMLVKPFLASLVCMCGLLVAAIICCRPLVQLVMPKYIDAVPIINRIIWASLLPVLQLPQTLLLADKKTIQLVVSSLSSFVGFLVSALLAVKLGWGLIGIIDSYLISRLIIVLMTFSFLGFDLSVTEQGFFSKVVGLRTGRKP
jgi:hypothetical protein